MIPILFGHRGIPTLAPENSLKSFKMILDYKIPGVELDIHLSKDGELVVIHDFSTLKMTGIDYKICETDYSFIKKLDIGDGEKIPLLKEVFNLLKHNVYYDLEIKSRGKNRRILVQKLYTLLKELNLENDCCITSFDPLILRHFNRLKSGIPVGIIYSKEKSVPMFLRNGFGLFFTHCEIIKPSKLQLKGLHFFIYTKVLKKKCYTWTVNTEEELDYAIKRGCLGIYTDVPQNFKPLMISPALRPKSR